MAQPEGVIPSQEDLLAELQALKLANPEMGAKRLQVVVKEKNSTWLVSEARVRKVAIEAGLLPAVPSRPITASLPHDRGFTLQPKHSGRFIFRINGMVVDGTASTGKWWDGRQPAACVMDERGRFDVRIQTAGHNNPIMVSSQCKSVMFMVELSEGAGVRDLFTMISRFPDFGGRMAYFSAQVTAPHTLFVFSDRIFSRNWDGAPLNPAAATPGTHLLSRSATSLSGDDLAQLPAAASAFMGRLADGHYGTREQTVADTCRPKNAAEEVQRLQEEGTDVARNEADPFGDGDQTPIHFEGAGCAHSALWASGGDLFDLVQEGKVPPVVIHFLSGNVSEIRAALDSARAHNRMTEFLEIRFGLLRSTPLMLVVMGCGQEFRCDDSSVRFDFVETMQLLLDAGARVDARDLCGKTVLHYLVGPLFKEPVGWSMLRACMERSRQLQLQPALADVQDRFGVTIVLYAVIMNLTKLVKVLCEDYRADTTVADWSGVSAHSFPTLNGDIKRAITKSSGRTIAAMDTCSFCKTQAETKKCAGCNVARYCSQKCQTDDWAAHSQVCRSSKTEIASQDGFVMRPRLGQFLATLSKSASITKWDGLLPPSVKLENGFFEIKVQTGSPTQAMMVYTRRKEICFTVEMNEGENLPALHAKIAAYPAFCGRKAYFFAKLVKPGELFVSGKQMFARDW
jgi:hypothetical protein